jgi:hypothetical protein
MRKGALEFDPKFGGRPRGEVQRHMIVFTNGYSRDEPAEVAQSLIHEQIHVFSVAVEDPNLSPDVEQLRLIASDKKVSNNADLYTTQFSPRCWMLNLEKLWSNWPRQNADFKLLPIFV